MTSPSPDLPASTRAALLHAAASCFARDGYRAATVAGIAREAGFTPPTIYAHFGSKQGMLEALVVELMEDLSAILARPVPTGLSLEARLVWEIEALLEMAAARKDLFALFLLRPWDIPLLAGHEEDDLALEQHWEAVFRAHADELGDVSPREAALALDGVLFAFTKAWMRSAAPSLAEQAPRLVALVLRGISLVGA